MARKGGLGKGLDALIPGGTSSVLSERDGKREDSGVIEVPLSKIVPNPQQPRTKMDEAELEGLAASIREHGILQPLVVSKERDSDNYVLIAGERRLRAAAMAGLVRVPVIIRQANEQQRLELALIENVQRADLTPLETAEAYHQLIDEFGLTHEEVSIRVGKSREAVTNTHRLVKLPDEIKEGLAQGLITEGHARALLGLESMPLAMADVYKTVLRNKLSVRQTEALVKELNGPRTRRTARKAIPAEVQEMEDQLRRYLGTRIKLRYGKDGGSLTIYYFSDEELNDMIAKIIKK
ncbi:MAG: ParB/RepB/Spo0J family partition protein [Chloroflexi bacterium]|nr:ParB/RepB/Spo0J family partition protein [Chloroflexota bacterium]